MSTQYHILTKLRYIAVENIVRKGEIASNEQFLLFLQCFLPYMVLIFHTRCTLILDSSKLNEFADDNFKVDENGRKFSKWVENTVGKGEIAPFPTVFSKHLYCRHVKTRAYLGKDYNVGCSLFQFGPV